MQSEHTSSLETLRDIRSIMERSSRFISLSGWSGVWAGCAAIAGCVFARNEITEFIGSNSSQQFRTETIDALYLKIFVMAFITFAVAFAGAFFFTMRKVKRQGQTLWSSASKKLMVATMLPLIAGGIFCLAFMHYGLAFFVVPTCLAFYGMALVNGGKYTLGEIRYLGYSELALGCISLFFPGYGLYFWAAGFGVLHILYGIIMWNKYDKNAQA